MTDIYENKLDKCALTFDEYKKSIQNLFKTLKSFGPKKQKL